MYKAMSNNFTLRVIFIRKEMGEKKVVLANIKLGNATILREFKKEKLI